MERHQVKIENQFDQNQEYNANVSFPSNLLSPKHKSHCFFQKWTIQENLAYAQFLKQNTNSLTNSFKRRSMKIFSQMSNQIRTRTSEQCRTHHQKMILQSQTIQKIIEKIEQKKRRLDTPRILKKRGRKPKFIPGKSFINTGKVGEKWEENKYSEKKRATEGSYGDHLELNNSNPTVIHVDWNLVDIL